MLRLFRVFFVSFSVPYVNVFFHILYAFFPRVQCEFRCLYICVILSCSFSTSLSSITLVTCYFLVPSTPFPAFGKPFSLSSVLYFAFSFLPSSVSYFVVIRFMFVFINLPSSYGKSNKFAGLIETRFNFCLKSALCLFSAGFEL